MRNANWHEEGGNARKLKGSEEETLAEHASPTNRRAKRGEYSGDQPTHKQALYPKGLSRRRARESYDS